MLITRPNLRNDRWHPWPFFRRLFDAAVSKSTLLVVLPVSWTFSQVSTSSGVAGNHRRSPNFLSQADSWKDKKRAYALLFGKATRDDVQWTSLITHWSLGDCVSIAAISDSCDMQQRCAQRCDIQIFLHIIYIYTYAVFLPKSTLVCGSLQGLNTKYVIMLEPDNTVPLGIIMDHLALFSSEFED